MSKSASRKDNTLAVLRVLPLPFIALAQLSGAVMSDTLFLCLEVLVLWALWKSLEGGSRVWPGILSIALAWAMLTRPAAVSLFAGIALALVLSRRWRMLAGGLVLPL